jgi:Domain of unknown function DUF29
MTTDWRSTYDTDFYAWTQDQSAHLRAKQWPALDVDHLAEEIESLGNEQAHAVESHLHIALLHLLKVAYQGQRRRGWLRSIDNARTEIERRLRRNRGLRPMLPMLLEDAYRTARRSAARQTGLPLATFPEACPWTLERVLDEDFLPAVEA